MASFLVFIFPWIVLTHAIHKSTYNEIETLDKVDPHPPNHLNEQSKGLIQLITNLKRKESNLYHDLVTLMRNSFSRRQSRSNKDFKNFELVTPKRIFTKHAGKRKKKLMDDRVKTYKEKSELQRRKTTRTARGSQHTTAEPLRLLSKTKKHKKSRLLLDFTLPEIHNLLLKGKQKNVSSNEDESQEVPTLTEALITLHELAAHNYTSTSEQTTTTPPIENKVSKPRTMKINNDTEVQKTNSYIANTEPTAEYFQTTRPSYNKTRIGKIRTIRMVQSTESTFTTPTLTNLTNITSNSHKSRLLPMPYTSNAVLEYYLRQNQTANVPPTATLSPPTTTMQRRDKKQRRIKVLPLGTRKIRTTSSGMSTTEALMMTNADSKEDGYVEEAKYLVEFSRAKEKSNASEESSDEELTLVTHPDLKVDSSASVTAAYIARATTPATTKPTQEEMTTDKGPGKTKKDVILELFDSLYHMAITSDDKIFDKISDDHAQEVVAKKTRMGQHSSSDLMIDVLTNLLNFVQIENREKNYCAKRLL